MDRVPSPMSSLWSLPVPSRPVHRSHLYGCRPGRFHLDYSTVLSTRKRRVAGSTERSRRPGPPALAVVKASVRLNTVPTTGVTRVSHPGIHRTPDPRGFKTLGRPTLEGAPVPQGTRGPPESKGEPVEGGTDTGTEDRRSQGVVRWRWGQVTGVEVAGTETRTRSPEEPRSWPE